MAVSRLAAGKTSRDPAERRSFKRVVTQVPARLRPRGRWHGGLDIEVPSVTADVSASGARVTCEAPAAVGDHIQLLLQLDDGALQVHARVLAAGPGQLRVQFENMTEQSTRRLVQQVNRTLLKERRKGRG